MKTVKIAFATNNYPASLIIKAFTLSKWCHCAIVDGDYIIDTTLLSGTRRIPFSEWKSHYREVEVVEVLASDTCDMQWARDQIGKKYDVLGIIGCYFRKNIQEKDRWFCSELVARYLGITNIPFYLNPQWLYTFTRVMANYK